MGQGRQRNPAAAVLHHRIVRIGPVRHLVQILLPVTVSRTAHGSVVSGTERIGSAYAEILPISAREVEIARGFSPTVNHRIRIRHRDDIDTRMRLQYNERTFTINGITDQDGRRRELLLYCTEVTS